MGARPGTCGDPGPGSAHCTEYPLHDWSCYDAGKDVSWNDGQWEWFDLPAHKCDDPACPPPGTKAHARAQLEKGAR